VTAAARRLGRAPWAGLCLLALLAAAGGRTASARTAVSTIAVFPVENLSGRGIPADAIRQSLMDGLSAAGFHVLGADAVEAFLVKHRIRYAAGIDARTAGLLRQDAGVDGVLFASVDLADAGVPPKLALTVRLVSVDTPPAVIWADDAGVAGDDAPGLFGLGLVSDYQALQSRTLDDITASVTAWLKTGSAAPGGKRASKFRPRSVYRTLAIDPAAAYSVAVLPFYNVSARRNAGDVVSRLFMRHLSAFGQLHVVDAGVTRQELLNARVIMDGGVSISDAETVASLVDADFVLAGRVLSYQDYEGPAGLTRVEFSAVLIDRKTRRMVFSSESDNTGSDGVVFFDRGRSRTAHVMATQMVRRTVEAMVGNAR
jgi:TolB-like protein